MSKPKITTGFQRYTDGNLEAKAQSIIDDMTGNKHFSKPVPSLAEISKALAEFIKAEADALSGAKLDRAVKEEKKTALIQQLNQLALYVQATGEGDETILVSSGFSLSKKPEPIGILEKPHDLQITPQEGGMIKMRFKAVKGAHSYRYEYKKVEDTEWEVVVHTKSNLLITGLESGKQYEFRVAGVGPQPERIFSDIIKSFVL